LAKRFQTHLEQGATSTTEPAAVRGVCAHVQGNICESAGGVDAATKAKMSQFVNSNIMMEEVRGGEPGQIHCARAHCQCRAYVVCCNGEARHMDAAGGTEACLHCAKLRHLS
jgi:hypothetical protein